MEINKSYHKIKNNIITFYELKYYLGTIDYEELNYFGKIFPYKSNRQVESAINRLIELKEIPDDTYFDTFDPDLPSGIFSFNLSYFEHGNCLWFIRGAKNLPDMRWDGVSRAGIWIPNDETIKTVGSRKDHIIKMVNSDLKIYNAMANGEVYELFCSSYVIKKENGEIITNINSYDKEIDTIYSGHIVGQDVDSIEIYAGELVEETESNSLYSIETFEESYKKCIDNKYDINTSLSYLETKLDLDRHSIIDLITAHEK